MSSQIEKTRQRRAVARVSVTRGFNEMEQILQCVPVDRYHATVSFHLPESKLKQLEVLDSEIFEIMLEDTTEEDLLKEVEVCDTYKRKFIDLKIIFDGLQFARGEQLNVSPRLNVEDTHKPEDQCAAKPEDQCAAIVTVFAPCLDTDYFSNRRHLCLDTKLDDALKSYNNQSKDSGGDEFFLVQYPSDVHKEVCKSMSEPKALESYEIPLKTTYKGCLKEYYNDYTDCIETYSLYQDKFVIEKNRQEMSDDDIFNRSAPNVIYMRSFVMVTYDPGPDLGSTKSAFVPSYQLSESEMTVIRPIDTEYGTLKGCHVKDKLQKQWGSTHTVKVFRQPNKSLGISIVDRKVEMFPGKGKQIGLVKVENSKGQFLPPVHRLYPLECVNTSLKFTSQEVIEHLREPTKINQGVSESAGVSQNKSRVPVITRSGRVSVPPSFKS